MAILGWSSLAETAEPAQPGSVIPISLDDWSKHFDGDSIVGSITRKVLVDLAQHADVADPLGIESALQHLWIIFPFPRCSIGEDFQQSRLVPYDVGEEDSVIIFDSRAQRIRFLFSRSLDDAVVVDRADENIHAVIGKEVGKTRIVISIRMRNHYGFEVAASCKLRVTPTEEAYEVVTLTSVDKNVLVIRSDNQAAISLANVYKNNFEQTILLNLCFAGPSFFNVTRANPDPTVFPWA